MRALGLTAVLAFCWGLVPARSTPDPDVPAGKHEAFPSGVPCCNGDADPSAAVPNAPAEASFAAQADAIMSGVYEPNEPGAALLVMKDAKVLMRKAYGMADLELGGLVRREACPASAPTALSCHGC